jgi:hypothetical protein
LDVLVDRFRESPVGTLVPISGFDPRFGEHYDHFAFVPLPLPVQVDLSGETWAVVSQAMLSLGRLDQAGRQILNPALVRRPTLRREPRPRPHWKEHTRRSRKSWRPIPTTCLADRPI